MEYYQSFCLRGPIGHSLRRSTNSSPLRNAEPTHPFSKSSAQPTLVKTSSLASLLLATAVALTAWLPAPALAAPIDNSFTYQGQLNDADGPATGDFDFSFRLFKTATTGGFAYGPITNVGVSVVDGQFTTSLDFGTNVFDGTAYWLRIDVRPSATNNAASFVTLLPRQKLTATPYALYAPQAGFTDNAASAGFASIAALATNATIAGGVSSNSITGAGIANATITAGKIAASEVVKSFNGLQDEVSLLAGANITLTTNTGARRLTVSAGPFSVRNETNIYYNDGNLGVGTNAPVRLLDVNGAVQLRGTPGAVGLVVRDDNNVGFGTTADYTGFASRVLTIQGDSGATNFPGTSAVVFDNPENNTKWSVATYTDGGLHFTKSGRAGIEELVVDAEVTCTAVNITSDRDAKEVFTPVNPRAVLAKVARLPISEWQYKTQPGGRHIGPMAQDFHSAFAVGHDEKHITTVDADGVALAAIQGLNEKLDEKDAELSRLKSENEILAARLSAIERALGMRPEATSARP